MPKSVLLFSSDVFNRQELKTFLNAVHIEGAKISIYDKSHLGFPYDAQVTRGDQFVNIAYEDRLTEEDDEETALAPIEQVLGAKPETCVLLDIGKYDPRSQLLGLEIASMLLEHWPGIIDVLRKVERRYLTRSDILALYEKGYSFLGRPIFPRSKGSRGESVVEKSEESVETG